MLRHRSTAEVSRPLLALAAIAMLAATPAPKPANFNAFGITALQKLAAQEKTRSVFISPASIGVALSMVADGTAGTARDEIVKALGTGANLTAANAAFIAALAANKDAQIGIADALWTRADIPPSPAYAGLLKDKYAAQAQSLRFGDPSAAASINAWTAAHTLGHITKLVDATDPLDVAYLTNALSFDGKWTTPFKKTDTHSAQFTPETGAAHPAQMMTRSGSFALMDGGTYRALRLPYGRGGFAAYVLLPNALHDADALLAKLSAGGFDKLAAGMQMHSLALSLPRFTAQYKTSLNGTLKSIGIERAFSGAADFSPLRKAPPHLFLSKVDHAAFVQVDEAGTVAAAATSAGISMTAIMVPPEKFTVDHPFIFAIRDEHTGNLLFVGVIRDV